MTTTTVSELMANLTANAATTTLAPEASAAAAALAEALSNIRFQQPWVLAAIPAALVVLLLYVRRGGLDRRKIIFFIVRAVLITALIAAIASPQMQETKTEVQEVPTIKILLDESPSMAVYGNQTGVIAEALRTALVSGLENSTEASQKIGIDVISSGDKTPLGNELYRVMTTTEGSSMVVLLSDGNSNYGKKPVDVARQMGKSNTTIYAVSLTPQYDDIYIEGVEGDQKVTSPLDYETVIEVRSTSAGRATYRLNIYVDGSLVLDIPMTQNASASRIPLKFSLNSAGVHEVAAQITSNEGNSIKSNDRMMKSVEVVEKPSILLVTNKTSSPLKTVLGDLYDIEPRDRIPSRLDTYDIIYLDDVNANSISQNSISTLKEYVLNGNGLAVVGGRNSFDYGNYNNSYFETLLPVLSMEKPVERRKDIAVLVLIDISASMGYGVSQEYQTTSKLDLEKALAIKIIRGLDVNDTVGVIAFKVTPNVIVPLEKLGDRRVDIEDNIVRLKSGETGGTNIITSLDEAERLLKYYAADKYVIVISDGVSGLYGGSTQKRATEKARLMASEGIKVYTVGIGFDTDENAMRELAEAGNGRYFKPEAYQRLNMEFSRGPEEEETGAYPIDVRDEYHFITRNANISASISGYNQVYEKSISQMLLSTRAGKPVLTVWNFGLGRVAALTTDDGLEWANSLYQKGNSRVISSMTNWVIGDLEKNKKVRIRSNDIQLGETETIVVESNSKPRVTIGNGGILTEYEVKTVGINKYAVDFKPNQTGFYAVAASNQEGADASGIAVNYAREYMEVTPDLDELSAIARAANGRLYYTSELEQLKQDVLQQMETISTKTITEETPLYPYLILAMLLIYFIDAAARRINDIRRLRT